MTRYALVASESQEQKLFFDWLDYLTISNDSLKHEPVREHIYAIPNGGFRNAVEAARLKGEGVTAGVPDISVDIASGSFHGLRIEMKRSGVTRASAEQIRHIELRRKMGYSATVCDGFDRARAALVTYLRLSWRVIDRYAS